MNDEKCSWCNGTGNLCMVPLGVMACLNCKGTGKGEDGGKGHKIKPPKIRAKIPVPLILWWSGCKKECGDDQ